MKASFFTLILFMVIGAAGNSALCAYLLPTDQVKQQCYWWLDWIGLNENP